MQYLGGKTRLAPRIAEIVNAERLRRGGALFWEPFCGGLSVSVRLAAVGPGIVSDACAPLIALYRAVRSGWDPPEHVSEADYTAARQLPDTDPRKAFIGFGCSFGAKWFGGYARSRNFDFASAARRIVRRDVAALGGCALECMSFFDGAISQSDLVLYCDPPYAGTETYSAVSAFDSPAFWARAQGWARAGAAVYASEYACPVPHTIELEASHSLSVAGGTALDARTERLFRVLP